MRLVKDHIVNPADEALQIAVTDDRGNGGANHRYEITGCDLSSNPSWDMPEDDPGDQCVILFQNGPVNSQGVNGITQEVLLAIVADRLRSFQAGSFSCKENAMALTKVEEALQWLHKRTLDRMRRGVEGQNIV